FAERWRVDESMQVCWGIRYLDGNVQRIDARDPLGPEDGASTQGRYSIRRIPATDESSSDGDVVLKCNGAFRLAVHVAIAMNAPAIAHTRPGGMVLEVRDIKELVFKDRNGRD